MVAGGIVGLGTRLGAGCTSGYGIYGIARGSRRSIFGDGRLNGDGHGNDVHSPSRTGDLTMKRLIAAAVCGGLFGYELVVSDLANPAPVLGFLDVAGDWDPTLLFVMVGALVPACLAQWLRRRMPRPVLDLEFCELTNRTFDTRLILGAAILGIGWGLVGFCPGPAIAALGLASMLAMVFASAMMIGMVGATSLWAVACNEVIVAFESTARVTSFCRRFFWRDRRHPTGSGESRRQGHCGFGLRTACPIRLRRCRKRACLFVLV